jgi:hypothetical protein
LEQQKFTVNDLDAALLLALLMTFEIFAMTDYRRSRTATIARQDFLFYLTAHACRKTYKDLYLFIAFYFPESAARL